MWFEATADGTVQLFTSPDTLKVRRLRRDPCASIVVAALVGERERWLSIAGSVTVDLAGILAEDQVRLVIHPETVNRYAY